MNIVCSGVLWLSLAPAPVQLDLPFLTVARRCLAPPSAGMPGRARHGHPGLGAGNPRISWRGRDPKDHRIQLLNRLCRKQPVQLRAELSSWWNCPGYSTEPLDTGMWGGGQGNLTPAWQEAVKFRIFLSPAAFPRTQQWSTSPKRKGCLGEGHHTASPTGLSSDPPKYPPPPHGNISPPESPSAWAWTCYFNVSLGVFNY